MTTVSIPVPDGVDKNTARRVALRAVEQAATISRVEKALAESEEPIGGGALAQAALREENWRKMETTWGLLNASEVVTLLGAKPGTERSLTANLRRRKHLLGVKRHGALRYPFFQFAQVRGTHGVAPSWTTLVEHLAPAQWDDAFVLIWAAAPNAYLEGASPAEVVQEHPDGLTTDVMQAIEHAIPDVRKRERQWA